MSNLINRLTATVLTTLLPFHHPLRRTLRLEGFEQPELPPGLRVDLAEQNPTGQNY